MNNYGFPTNPTNSTQIGGANFRRIFGALNSQLGGALAALGAGPVRGWLATPGIGATVNLTAGAGIVNISTDGAGLIYIESASKVVPLPEGIANGDTFYIFVTAEIADDAGDPDSREDAHPVFVVQETDTLSGAILLAQVDVTADSFNVTDRRTFSDSSNLLLDLVDTGRLVGTDLGVGAPHEPVTTSLSVVLPTGGRWLIAGQYIVLSNDVILDNVPPNSTSYGFLSINPASGEPAVLDTDWFSAYPSGDTLEALRAAGKPCLGKVTASATTVTAIDSSTAGRADLVYTQAGLITLLGSSGTEESGPAYWSLLAKTASDAQTIEQYVQAQLDALKAELLDAIANQGTRTQITSLDTLMHSIALLRDSVVALQPDDGERHEAALVVKTPEGIYGDGSDNHPDHIDTELEIDEETGEINP